MSQCNETFDRIAGTLGGFSCRDAPAIIHLRNPFGLTNWTLPVLELMMVAGAVLALVFAIGRLRRGDPTNLALWVASVIYLLVIEIPLYFPDKFGVQEQIGVVFDHNVFTVQFLYERLPLYIVALYPAVTTLAYEIVRALGVFGRRGILTGAICVGFVHHCFYEVFDQLGPQLRWWAWNGDNPLNHPMFSSVPMTSVYIFAALGPAVLTFLVLLFVGRPSQQGSAPGGLSLALRTLAAGVLVPIGVALLSIPSSIFGGAHPNVTAQAIAFSVELAIFAVVAVPTLIGQWRQTRHADADHSAPSNPVIRIFGPVYLAVLAVLWATALPEYFDAVDGITDDGTPTGNLAYAAVCFVIAVLCVAAAISALSPHTVSSERLAV